MPDSILPGHGSGGKLMNDLINDIIRETLGSQSIQLDDSAVLSLSADKIAFTTDSYTITPIEFPGGNIGSLAVNGTVNDLAVMGAEPLYLSCGIILEEGLALEELKMVLQSMRKAADYAGVSIVTGDTKVVPRGKGDKIYINTAGVGVFKTPVQRQDIQVGDAIIINGYIGDHGTAVMAERNKLSFSRGLLSDCAPLNNLIGQVTAAFPGSIRFMRDATRGGVASVLNEITKDRPFGAKLVENSLPVHDEVRGVSELLGIEPLYIANEGKVVIIADKNDADGIVSQMKKVSEGKDAAIIGEITDEYAGNAYITTRVGGNRMLPLLIEEQLPRIC